MFTHDANGNDLGVLPYKLTFDKSYHAKYDYEQDINDTYASVKNEFEKDEQDRLLYSINSEITLAKSVLMRILHQVLDEYRQLDDFPLRNQNALDFYFDAQNRSIFHERGNKENTEGSAKEHQRCYDSLIYFALTWNKKVQKYVEPDTSKKNFPEASFHDGFVWADVKHDNSEELYAFAVKEYPPFGKVIPSLCYNDADLINPHVNKELKGAKFMKLMHDQLGLSEDEEYTGILFQQAAFPKMQQFVHRWHVPEPVSVMCFDLQNSRPFPKKKPNVSVGQAMFNKRINAFWDAAEDTRSIYTQLVLKIRNQVDSSIEKTGAGYPPNATYNDACSFAAWFLFCHFDVLQRVLFDNALAHFKPKDYAAYVKKVVVYDVQTNLIMIPLCFDVLSVNFLAHSVATRESFSNRTQDAFKFNTVNVIYCDEDMLKTRLHHTSTGSIVLANPHTTGFKKAVFSTNPNGKDLAWLTEQYRNDDWYFSFHEKYTDDITSGGKSDCYFWHLFPMSAATYNKISRRQKDPNTVNLKPGEFAYDLLQNVPRRYGFFLSEYLKLENPLSFIREDDKFRHNAFFGNYFDEPQNPKVALNSPNLLCIKVAKALTFVTVENYAENSLCLATAIPAATPRSRSKRGSAATPAGSKRGKAATPRSSKKGKAATPAGSKKGKAATPAGSKESSAATDSGSSAATLYVTAPPRPQAFEPWPPRDGNFNPFACIY